MAKCRGGNQKKKKKKKKKKKFQVSKIFVSHSQKQKQLETL